jgi:hypothetical protein
MLFKFLYQKGSDLSRLTSRRCSCTARERWLGTLELYTASSHYTIDSTRGGWSRPDYLARWHSILTRRLNAR